ncbi:MAG TPA: ABC transporter ATP-binding protein [Magnetospirillum sp.]|nr:ABC transporter ATP-binding protein [Magnetospirillum sp.]
MMAAVELDGVVKLFGPREAVAGVTLSVPAGERLALLGHNGAGKTTLMKLMLGLMPPSAGRIRVLGEAPGDVTSEARRAIGFLPESVVFQDSMTGAELIGFYARLKGRTPREGLGLLDQVGLAAAAGRRVSTYSKGMRQRLGLAQAMLGHPRLLLLDEPTSGLDPELRQAFYEIVRARAADGAAVILSSHVLTELEERTDRIAIMDHGRLVALGRLDELRRRAGLPVVVRARLRSGEEVALSVPPEAKMDTLRTLMARDPQDLGVTEPGLDDLYAYFLAEGACRS